MIIWLECEQVGEAKIILLYPCQTRVLIASLARKNTIAVLTSKGEIDVKLRLVPKSMDIDCGWYKTCVIHDNDLSAGVGNKEVIDYCFHGICQPGKLS